MENHNQHTTEVEIIKEAKVHIIDSNNHNDETDLVKVLKGEISRLKATNASLNIKLQELRERHLPYIFLVEDDYDTAQTITELLSDDYNVIDVGNGIEALSIIRKIGKVGSDIKRIDVILLNVDLPGMCGFTLCREVKKSMKLNIPVIFCTAKNTKKDVIKAIDAGANDYIIKPFQEKTLLGKLEKWIKIKKKLGGQPLIT